MIITLLYAPINDLRAALNNRLPFLNRRLAFFFTTSYVSANCSHTPLLSGSIK